MDEFARALKVMRRTWKLVEPILGGEMPEVKLYAKGEPMPTSPGAHAYMWAERKGGDVNLQATVEAHKKWLEAGGVGEFVPVRNPVRDIVHVPWPAVKDAASPNVGRRRIFEKKSLHEFKHTRQSNELRADPIAREKDAGQFARRYAPVLLAPTKNKAKGPGGTKVKVTLKGARSRGAKVTSRWR